MNAFTSPFYSFCLQISDYNYYLFFWGNGARAKFGATCASFCPMTTTIMIIKMTFAQLNLIYSDTKIILRFYEDQFFFLIQFLNKKKLRQKTRIRCRKIWNGTTEGGAYLKSMLDQTWQISGSFKWIEYIVSIYIIYMRIDWKFAFSIRITELINWMGSIYGQNGVMQILELFRIE